MLLRRFGVVVDCDVTESVSMALVLIEVAVIFAVVIVGLELLIVLVLIFVIAGALSFDVATVRDVALVFVFTAILK